MNIFWAPLKLTVSVCSGFRAPGPATFSMCALNFLAWNCNPVRPTGLFSGIESGVRTSKMSQVGRAEARATGNG